MSQLAVKSSSAAVSNEVMMLHIFVSGTRGSKQTVTKNIFNKSGQCGFLKWVGDIAFKCFNACLELQEVTRQ